MNKTDSVCRRMEKALAVMVNAGRHGLKSERRNCIRHTLKPSSEGMLFLAVDGHPMTILEVKDISPFGISLLIDGQVNNGLEVGLRYTRGTSDIEVFGTVVWNSIVESDSCESSVGIYFRTQDVQLNTVFFKAMRA